MQFIDLVGIYPDEKEAIGNCLILRGLGYQDICNLIPKDVVLIALSGIFSSEGISYKALVNLIKNNFQNAYLVAGGEHFSAAPEELIKREI